MRTILIPLLLLPVGFPATVSSQRGVHPVTATGVAHASGQLSPNGNWIASITSNNGVPALAIVTTTTSSKENLLFTSNTLTSFCWAPDNTGLYFGDGTTLNYVRTLGGNPTLIAKVSGVAVRLHAVDPAGKFLMGTRTDAQGNNSIFRVASNGTSAPVDLMTSLADFFDEVAIDPSGQKFAYTSQSSGVPHAPIDVRMADIDGKNARSLITSSTVKLPRDLCWADAGTTLLFAAFDGFSVGWRLLRVTTSNGTPQPLTDGTQQWLSCGISGDRQWIVYRGTTAAGYQGAGVMPAAGGGRIPLEPETDWVFSGEPSIDGGALSVAFAGSPNELPLNPAELQLIQLDREIEITPRASLGATLTFKLPLLFGESGTLFLSPALLPPHPQNGPFVIPIPGFVYGVAIDPTILIPLGGGSGQTWSTMAQVPNDTALVGFTAYLQALRVRSTNPDKGDFTRYVELTFFP